jgi:hypothetical protein
MPESLAALAMRTAISPRLAIRTLVIFLLGAVIDLSLLTKKGALLAVFYNKTAISLEKPLIQPDVG